jgi:hypothetical protein
MPDMNDTGSAYNVLGGYRGKRVGRSGAESGLIGYLIEACESVRLACDLIIQFGQGHFGSREGDPLRKVSSGAEVRLGYYSVQVKQAFAVHDGHGALNAYQFHRSVYSPGLEDCRQSLDEIDSGPLKGADDPHDHSGIHVVIMAISRYFGQQFLSRLDSEDVYRSEHLSSPWLLSDSGTRNKTSATLDIGYQSDFQEFNILELAQVG